MDYILLPGRRTRPGQDQDVLFGKTGFIGIRLNPVAPFFGINGQDGYYLNELLIKNKIQVFGVSRSTGNWTQGNVGDGKFVEDLIKNIQPTYIFHLAANSTTKHYALFENHETIFKRSFRENRPV